MASCGVPVKEGSGEGTDDHDQLDSALGGKGTGRGVLHVMSQLTLSICHRCCDICEVEFFMEFGVLALACTLGKFLCKLRGVNACA